MATADVYLLTLHKPYQDAQDSSPINATIVPARSLLQRALPQPDAGRIYRCLTEFPDRFPGCVVPLSTLTYELDGGDLWQHIADFERVLDLLVTRARQGHCDALRLGLPQRPAVLLANGPKTAVTLHGPGGSRITPEPEERAQYLEELAAHVRQAAAQEPLWPGEDLLPPPAEPRAMPYRPYRV